MTAELISVGTELLLGETVDTNSAWVARELAKRGVDVYWSLRIGDNRRRVREAIAAGLERSDILILIGGLGPTDDDVTREAIADALAQEPFIDPVLEADLRGYFARTGRSMPEQNVKQAWRLPSSEALPNALGTAPGWLVRTTRDDVGRIIVALPGPPRELKRMWRDEALPRLALPQSTLHVTTFKTLGLGESSVASALAPLTDGANPSVATYARDDGVHVRVAAKAQTTEDADRLAAPVVAQIEKRLEGLIWGKNEQRLGEVVLESLRRQGAQLAVMESVTGGMVADVLVANEGSSAAFAGGVIAYTQQAKAAFGVPQALLDKCGSVSAEVAASMATAAAQRFDAALGLATTGVAGPGPHEGKAVGTAYVAIHDRRDFLTRVEPLSLPALERQWIRKRIANAALATLLEQLRG